MEVFNLKAPELGQIQKAKEEDLKKSLNFLYQNDILNMAYRANESDMNS